MPVDVFLTRDVSFARGEPGRFRSLFSGHDAGHVAARVLRNLHYDIGVHSLDARYPQHLLHQVAELLAVVASDPRD